MNVKRRSLLLAVGAVFLAPRFVIAAPVPQPVETLYLVTTVKDRRHQHDPMKFHEGYARGDVVDILRAGAWMSSGMVCAHDFWRVIPVEGWSMEQAVKLLRPGPVFYSNRFSARAGRRGLTLNLEHASLSTSFAAYIADDERAHGIWPGVLRSTEVDAIIERRPAADPLNLLVLGGGHSGVIG